MRWIGFSVTILGLALGCGDDGESSDGDGSGSGTSTATSSMSSTSDGSSDNGDQGSVSGDDGPGTQCCVDACPEGTMAGDSCSGYQIPPPCCTATDVLLCADAACGSQSCVGTWESASCSDCEVLQPRFLSLLADARNCDPDGPPDQCIVSESLTDTCGCQVSVAAAADLTAVEAAYDDWVGRQCGPLGCGAPCPVGEPTCATYDVNGETFSVCELSG